MKKVPLRANNRWAVSVILWLASIQLTLLGSDKERFEIVASRFAQSHCVDCHGNREPEAELNLEKLSADPLIATRFREWRKIAEMIEQRKMPPKDAESLGESERVEFAKRIRQELRTAALKHANDPGEVTIRRLTSAEYGYTIQDLIGYDLNVNRDFVSDAVGGEGFTNVGGAQFVQDSTLERYLAAAKQVAEHAVIGTGPLRFFEDPGATGLELSAMNRIQAIYRQHGFRTAAGEGGEAFGLDRYGSAFFVAWKYANRKSLGIERESFTTLARAEGIDTRFADYIHSVVTAENQSFPTSDIVDRWQALPVPDENTQIEKVVRQKCNQIQAALHAWQNRLGENADAKEEARVLSENEFDVSRAQLFEMNINWPKGTKTAHLTFFVESADRVRQPDVAIIWRNANVQFRIPDLRLEDPKPLRTIVSKDVARRLAFGKHARGGNADPDDFVTIGVASKTIELPIREGATSARLLVEAELDIEHGDDRIIRCTIAQQEETDQGKSVSALIANPESRSFDMWKRGVLEFARVLPQISQREPAPSDRDPIPVPFDPSYNNPERNHFHARIKYHREDSFLVRNILDDVKRRELDQAWSDLLESFDYHNVYLRAIADKFEIDLPDSHINKINRRWIEDLPDEPRTIVQNLQQQYREIQTSFEAAQPGHLDDVLQFANRAWRRPVTDQERARLIEFYRTLRKQSKLTHDQSIQALVTRVLISPAFLYRAEGPTDAGKKSTPTQGDLNIRPLTNWELASRLSYFLTSSLPDGELRRAADAGELADPDQLVRQARRLIRSPNTRRLSREFFGQWFGFYQFDRHRGVDPERFPEFTEQLKTAMYDEAVSFFNYIVQNDRPLREILFADYRFLNRELAEHYSATVDWPTKAGVDGFGMPSYVDDVNDSHRGGLLGLGAVLTVTSAPRRTSPVKRGDWILRRVLNAPVPRPPADAGSIPADDVLSDGKTIRQRLAAHRRESSCINCHSRIDPLGFALEQFDAVGRKRERYRDGQAINPTGTLASGQTISGPDGLRKYLEKHEEQFYHTLCTKLVGYAFGRRESIADAVLIDKMLARIEGGGRFSSLVEEIVRSPQFRFQRLARTTTDE